VILNASGGTGTITVDNNNVAAEASSVYYTSQSGNDIVKATQAALQQWFWRVRFTHEIMN